MKIVLLRKTIGDHILNQLSNYFGNFLSYTAGTDTFEYIFYICFSFLLFVKDKNILIQKEVQYFYASKLTEVVLVAWVLFTNGRKMEKEIGRWISAASVVMRALHWSVVVKREASQKERHLV